MATATATATKTKPATVEAPKSKFSALVQNDPELSASGSQAPAFIQTSASEGKIFLSEENAKKCGFRFDPENSPWVEGSMEFKSTDPQTQKVTKTKEPGYFTDRLRAFILGSSTFEAKDKSGNPIIKQTKSGKSYNQLDTRVYLALVDDSNTPLTDTFVTLTLKGGTVFGSTFSETWNRYKVNPNAWLRQVWEQFTRMTGNRGGKPIFQSGFVFEINTALKSVNQSDCCFVVGHTPITDSNVEDETMCGFGHPKRPDVVVMFNEAQAVLDQYRKPKTEAPTEGEEFDDVEGDY